MVALLSDCHVSTYVDDIKKDNEANQSSHKVLTDLQSLQSTSVGIEINSQLFFPDISPTEEAAGNLGQILRYLSYRS